LAIWYKEDKKKKRKTIGGRISLEDAVFSQTEQPLGGRVSPGGLLENSAEKKKRKKRNEQKKKKKKQIP